ncbi:MAG: nicotinate-nucleotide adenylyltransferase [Lachnospiraceae bacterium]|nr:nicotinate-nucleotide adenylyltransferase [Lachnospiraceae bacterium]
MRIGIMGGTFNPIHNGHLLIAENAYHQFHLDKILFMVAGNPPHKTNLTVVDSSHRCQMVKEAILNVPYFELDEREVHNQRLSYTYLTLTELKQSHPEDEFFFIMGADSLLYFEKWRNPEIILEKATVLIAVRDMVDSDKVLSTAKEITKKLGGTMDLIQTPMFDVSSNNIRSRIANKDTVRYLLPDSVIDYIKKNNLYTL